MLEFFTPAAIGGWFLILGAYFTMRGNIFRAVGTYFFADFAWVYLSYISGDVFGSIQVAIGMTLGLVAFIKMNYGKMRKTLDL